MLKFTFGAITDQGLNRKRKANEDRYLVLPERGIFLVADGVGGRRAGQIASQTVVDVFTEAFASLPGSPIMPLVEGAIERCNQRIYSSSMEAAELSGMATTIALVAVDGDQAIIGHVGDSRVYRFDGQSLTCETEDHSEVHEAVREGLLSADQAASHPRRNVINRALGVEPEVEADYKTSLIEGRTGFLLCSDGITRHVSDSEIEEIFRKRIHPDFACERLKELCYARGAEDNLTAVVVDFGDREYADEPTHPSRVAQAGQLSASRIEVAFRPGAADDNHQPSEQPMPEQSMPQRSLKDNRKNSRRSSVVGGVVQLALTVLLIAAAFFAGRNYEQVRGWITGTPAGSQDVSQADSSGKPDAELAAGRALYEERRFEKARDRFAELSRRDPSNAQYHYWLGRAFLETRQFQEAVKSLREAARIDPAQPNVYMHLALAYSALGDRRNADESLRQALSQASNQAAPESR